MDYPIQKMLLENVQAVTNKYAELNKRSGEEFNIFSILKMERLEYHTHSAFLYEFLSPNGSHNQGDVYLKIFVRDILEIKDFKWGNIIVEREKSIGTDGRIDLVIEGKENLLVIEIKIDAVDQDNQLKRYQGYAKRSGKKYKIYYLTLSGDEASTVSVGDNKADVEYMCLSFRYHILKWLKKSLRADNTPLIPTIRESLAQYIQLIEKITGQGNGGIRMEIKNLLLKDNNLRLAEQLVQAIPYAKAEIEYEFWKRFYEEYNPLIEAFGFEYREDNFFEINKEEAMEVIVEERKNKKGDINFEYVLKKIDDREMVIWLGQTGYDKSVYMSIGILGHDKLITYTEWSQALQQHVSEIGFILSPKDKDYKYRYMNTEVNFYNESIYKLLGNKEEVVKLIGKEVVEICKYIYERIDEIKF